jgi:hypothetical protein
MLLLVKPKKMIEITMEKKDLTWLVPCLVNSLRRD